MICHYVNRSVNLMIANRYAERPELLDCLRGPPLLPCRMRATFGEFHGVNVDRHLPASGGVEVVPDQGKLHFNLELYHSPS